MTKTNKNQIKVPKNVQSKTAIANDQRKHWICVWVEMNYHFKNIRLIKGITNEKHYIFSKSLCSFLKTGKLNVRDIISWLSFDSPSESEFSITHEFSLFHLTTLGSDKFLSSYTNTIYKKTKFAHKNYSSLLPCTLENEKVIVPWSQRNDLQAFHAFLKLSNKFVYSSFTDPGDEFDFSRIKIYFQSHHSCTYTGNFLLGKLQTKSLYPEEVTRKMSDTETCHTNPCLGQNLLAQMTDKSFQENSDHELFLGE